MPSCPPRRWKPWGPLLLLIAAGQPQPFVVVKELYKGIEVSASTEEAGKYECNSVGRGDLSNARCHFSFQDLYKKSSHINVISITRHLRSRGIWIHRQVKMRFNCVITDLGRDSTVELF
jgi:hypothetical protein